MSDYEPTAMEKRMLRENDKLRHDLAHARSELNSADTREGMHRQTIDTLRAEVERLRGALHRYGEHWPNCDRVSRPATGSGPWKCSCGYTAALAAADGDVDTGHLDAVRIGDPYGRQRKADGEVDDER